MKNTRRNKMMSAAIRLIVLASGTGLFVAAQTPAPTPQINETRELLSAQTLEREMTGAETHRYKLVLQKDEFFQVRVEQKGVDIALKLLDVIGKELATMDSPNSKEGSETLSFVATTSGNYTLEVKGFDAKAEKGIYTIRRESSRTATAQDRRRVEIEKTFVEGMTARDIEGQKEIALAKFEKALQGWQEISDRYLTDLTLQQVKQLKKTKADAIYKEATELTKQGTAESLRTAMQKFKLASELFRQADAKQKQSQSLVFSGVAADRLGEKSAALESYIQALSLFRLLENKPWETVTLNNIGLVYDDLGEKQKALEYFNRALPLSRDIDEKRLEATILSNIGKVYGALGEKQKALEYYNQSLPLSRAVDDKGQEAVTLNNIGTIYHDLDEKRKAVEYYLQALPIRRVIDDKHGEAVTLNNIGGIYADLGEKQKALDYYNQVLSLQRTAGDKSGEATTLTNIGGVYYDLGEKQKALDYYNQALPLLRAVGDKRVEAVTLNNIGKVYDDLGEKQKALEYYQVSLSLKKVVGDKSGEANTLDLLMGYWKGLNNPRFAVFYGKQSVNLLQELRLNINKLDKGIQRTYLKSIESTYRKLADILIAEGRVAETEQVLGMLKEEEYFDYLRRDDKVAADLKANINLTSIETEAFKRYEENADSITRIGKEFDELEQESKKFPVGKFPRQAELDKLDAQLADARKVFNKFLEELDARFRNKETKQQDSRVAQISSTKALLDSLNQPRTVIISTIAGEDRLNLIVTTSKINRAHTVEIKSADLNKLVVEFRDAVKNPKVDPRPVGKKLYDVLFPADLQKDLAGVQADTIVWSLDGTLRYAPIAALWDGKQYVAERYANAIITLASRDKIDKVTITRKDWTALGVGVSKEFETFPALKAVPEELCRVVNDPQKKAECLKLTGGKTGVMNGVNLSDDEFTFETFKLHLGRYKIVHVASHFSLNAGNESDSYLLLGGGKTNIERKLTLAAVREQLDTKFVGTELLVLSACNTAMTAGENSSGAEIEGFGALAQQQGAKTVLASLWAVADASTRDLMTEFYKELETNPNTGKAEALRKAQLKLIYGKYKVDESLSKRDVGVMKFGIQTDLPPFMPDPNAPFAHPFYWSPFILFGNWK